MKNVSAVNLNKNETYFILKIIKINYTALEFGSK